MALQCYLALPNSWSCSLVHPEFCILLASPAECGHRALDKRRVSASRLQKIHDKQVQCATPRPSSTIVHTFLTEGTLQATSAGFRRVSFWLCKC